MKVMLVHSHLLSNYLMMTSARDLGQMTQDVHSSHIVLIGVLNVSATFQTFGRHDEAHHLIGLKR
jgi:hypothetical protein